MGTVIGDLINKHQRGSTFAIPNPEVIKQLFDLVVNLDYELCEAKVASSLHKYLAMDCASMRDRSKAISHCKAELANINALISKPRR